MARKSIETKPAEPTVTEDGEVLETPVVEEPTGDQYPEMGKDTTVRPELSPGMHRIVSRIFDSNEDVWETYQRLERALRVGERRTDYATLMEALDNAEDNCRAAHRLYCVARVEQERIELDSKVLDAAARREATWQLEAEKEAGQRKKQITEGDIEARILEVFPDEAKRLAELRLKLRKMVESMQDLHGNWSSRCRSLQTMVAKVR